MRLSRSVFPLKPALGVRSASSSSKACSQGSRGAVGSRTNVPSPCGQNTCGGSCAVTVVANGGAVKGMENLGEA